MFELAVFRAFSGNPRGFSYRVPTIVIYVDLYKLHIIWGPTKFHILS